MGLASVLLGGLLLARVDPVEAGRLRWTLQTLDGPALSVAAALSRHLSAETGGEFRLRVAPRPGTDDLSAALPDLLDERTDLLAIVPDDRGRRIPDAVLAGRRDGEWWSAFRARRLVDLPCGGRDGTGLILLLRETSLVRISRKQRALLRKACKDYPAPR